VAAVVLPLAVVLSGCRTAERRLDSPPVPGPPANGSPGAIGPAAIVGGATAAPPAASACYTAPVNAGAADEPAPPPGDEVRWHAPKQAGDEGDVQTTAAPAAAPPADRPAVPPPCAEHPTDLQTALALAGAENPTIALAAEAVRASEAELLQARALLLPTLNAGMNYRLHRGNLLSSTGIMRDVDSDSLYVGAGAGAVGGGTVAVPGVRVFAHLADAWFEPVAARQRVTGTGLEARAVRNDMLLHTAVRYFDLLGAEARLAAVRQAVAEFREVADLTANFARSGQGRQSDADRTRGDLQLLLADAARAEEEVATAAAEMARLLDLDPSGRLRAAGDPLVPVTLVPPDAALEPLVQTAVANRPEVGAAVAAIAVALTRLREERVRPLVPLISVGYSAGNFGGGSNQVEPRFGRFDGRTDFDAWAVWSLANFGLGNVAVQRERRAEVGQAEAERVRVIDRVRREVAEAYALVAARRRQAETARRKVATAEEGVRLDLRRARNVEGRPIEVLNSLRLLNAARQELIRATVGYNQAQFQLFAALGQPPTIASVLGCSDAPPGGQ
jgi:outer membrane protein TolC